MILNALAVLGLLGAEPQEPSMLAAADVVVTEQSARPDVVSGILATFVLVQARVGDEGSIRRFYFPYMSETQQFPQPGARCYFWSLPRRIEVVGGYASPPDLEGDVVTAFDCGPRPLDDGEVEH